MAESKQTKVLTKRRKFIDVEIPLTRQKLELVAESPEELLNRTIKLDLTRQLKGKSVEAIVKIEMDGNKPVANPKKLRLMSYFIRRMIRKRISYVEDSFVAKSQDSLLVLKPFMITRKRVSRAIRKTLRNKAKNWLEDYVSQKKDIEVFGEILTNKLQKSLSLMLKKTYPLSLCEIRVLEIKRPLNPEEVPKIIKKEIKETQIEEGIDQMKEIEEEMIKKAEKEIKETQEKATEIEKEDNLEEKPKKKSKKKEENIE